MICHSIHPPSCDNPRKEMVILFLEKVDFIIILILGNVEKENSNLLAPYDQTYRSPKWGPFEWLLLDPVIFATPPKGI